VPEQPAWRSRERSTARSSETTAAAAGDPSKCQFLQDRGTSAAEDEHQVSRIGRDSEPYSVRLTRYVRPATADAALQTEQYYLKERKASDLDTFDYFDHVKKTMQYIANNPLEKQKLEARISAAAEESGKGDERFQYKRAPMSGFLPSQEAAPAPAPTNGYKSSTKAEVRW